MCAFARAGFMASSCPLGLGARPASPQIASAAPLVYERFEDEQIVCLTALARSASSMSSRKTVGFSGALGSGPAAPMTMKLWLALTASLAQSWSSLRTPPLTMTFMRSTGTPVAS